MAKSQRYRPNSEPSLGRASEGAVAGAVAEFGRTVAEKLGRGGAPEDQLRGPVEVLLKRLSLCMGLDAVAYGEVALRSLRARPDYAVDVGDSRIGYVELKAPGRGVPHEWKPEKREREQWNKLRALPNVIYTDGTSWRRYSYGEPTGSVVRLAGQIDDPRRPLRTLDSEFEQLILDFLTWCPERPRSLSELIRVVAGLCRLLRDEVEAILKGTPDHAAYEDLSLLAADWRELLFPGLDDRLFADAYSQTIAYSMLLARINGVSLEDTTLHEVARQLGKKHSLMGRAFAVLTDSEATEELRTIETLRRVVSAVSWSHLDDGQTDVYAELYEKFLEEYDPGLRKQSGSYYTPRPVAQFLVDFVNEILCSRLKQPWGLASDDVVVVDPAMGTGTFLVEIVRSVAETVTRRQGIGARASRLRDLFSKRLVGFEIQVAPYAVAELRLHQVLKTVFGTDVPASEVRFLTDTLENPREQQQRLSAAYKIIERSRDEANRIKRDVPVMAVIGNPPHVENTKGKAAWIEAPRDSRLWPAQSRRRPSLDEFRAIGQGQYESDLHGLPWLFWRWSLWKAFEAHPEQSTGVVAFVTPSSLIKGKAFGGVREYLRRVCDEGWIIDLSPEGNRPKMSTRVFGASVSRQLCLAVFARYSQENRQEAALVHYIAVEGARQDKLDQLSSLDPDGGRWGLCRSDWIGAFLPMHNAEWDGYPGLSDVMPWRSRGVTTGRGWVYAPHPEPLRRRWRRLISARASERPVLFKEGRDRKVDGLVKPLPGFSPTLRSIREEQGDCPELVPVAFRSFDRQWIIPDNRLMEMPRPPLWEVRSERQIFVTTQDSHALESGPGLVFTAMIPDLHHFNSRAGGVLPLYRDRTGEVANFAPGLTDYLAGVLDAEVNSEGILAYIAGVVAHRGYTRHFRDELREPGIRIPVTVEPVLWDEAVSIGSEILWLHTFGERFVDIPAGRPRGVLAMAEKFNLRVVEPIAASSIDMPSMISHESASGTLCVGNGRIQPVGRAVYEYDVGGLRVIRHWFDYRKRVPSHKRRSSPLDDINLEEWGSELTDEILGLVAAVTGCVELEERQLDLLNRIVAGPLIRGHDLVDAGILPVDPVATKAPRTSTAARLGE